MTRKDARDAIARDLTRWVGLSGPMASRVAAQALSTLEVEGYVTFDLDDITGKDL